MNRLLFGVILCLCVGAVAGQSVEPELFAPGVVSGPVNDAAPAFSPDGQTVYFHRGGPGMITHIFVAHLHDGVWSKPEVASFSGRWSDIEPVMAPEGSYLVFSSNRPIAPDGKELNGCWNSQHYAGGGGNLWRVDRVGSGWGEPRRLPDVINSDSSVFSPAVTADGSIFFMKPVGDTGRFHLLRSACRNGGYEKPTPVAFSAPDSVSDVDPTVAADESFLVFSSKRAPGRMMELFIVFRKNGVWGVPQALGPAVSRGMYEIEARLSPDGRKLYFSSAYAPKREKAAEWETGSLNIWWVPLDAWVR
jgi:Tol biopolymer transport system component